MPSEHLSGESDDDSQAQARLRLDRLLPRAGSLPSWQIRTTGTSGSQSDPRTACLSNFRLALCKAFFVIPSLGVININAKKGETGLFQTSKKTKPSSQDAKVFAPFLNRPNDPTDLNSISFDRTSAKNRSDQIGSSNIVWCMVCHNTARRALS